MNYELLLLIVLTTPTPIETCAGQQAHSRRGAHMEANTSRRERGGCE